MTPDRKIALAAQHVENADLIHQAARGGVSMSEHTAENDAAPAPSWRDVVRLARLALALRMPWAPPWVQRRVAGPGNRVTLVFPPERSEA